MATALHPPTAKVLRPEPDRWVIELSGDWKQAEADRQTEQVWQQLTRASDARRVVCQARGLEAWDSRLLALVVRCADWCRTHGAEFDPGDLPAGLQRLLQLARAVPEKGEARRAVVRMGWVHRLGEATLVFFLGVKDALSFLGEAALAFGRLASGRARFRWSDLLLIVQRAGPEALGVVGLINFLVGMILGFVGSIQLEQFGASVYVADLVGVATVREMGCIMTGIIMCGRTGAAFAAQLGTMKVNEEIDAFRTLAISPMEFLVLPRVLALALMMPLLCVFADGISILGGYLVAVSMLDLTAAEYMHRTVASITVTSFSLGIIKSFVFGVLVALTGCRRGMQSGSNAAAVGLATTSAVVTGITLIIAADAVFAVLCRILNI